MDITVILTGYRRGHTLEEQYQAILGQSLPPKEILLWYNHPGQEPMNFEVGSKMATAFCNYNFGVWSRFAFALMAKHQYVCIFDDDTIPGRRWLENCYNTMQSHNGLLGTIGMTYPKPFPANDRRSSYYMDHVKPGWMNPNEEVVEVDLVGHSWFFKKEWLSDYWREQPDPKYNICGEDMHFSYMLQKYRGLGTYVPPHPAGNKELWGSLKKEYTVDQYSIHENNVPTITGVPMMDAVNEFFVSQRRKGWKLLKDPV
jgi:hypothetical protein